MKHITKIFVALTVLSFASCSSERYHQFSKIKVKQTEMAQLQKLETTIQISSKTLNPKSTLVELENSQITSIARPVIAAPKNVVLNNNIQNALKAEDDINVLPKPISNENVISTPNPKSNGLSMDGFALTGFITGILSFFILPFLFGTIAVIFSAIGLARIIKGKSRGKGFAITGLVLGIISFIYVLAVLGSI